MLPHAIASHNASPKLHEIVACIDRKFTTTNEIHPGHDSLFQEHPLLPHWGIMKLPGPSPAPPLVGLLPLSHGGRMGL